MNKMNILHYSLGFPPYRSGGMTKFCMDIMKEQKRLGNNVALLWPGEIRSINKAPKIKKRKNVGDILSFEIINPLPISYDEGIAQVNYFMKNTDKKNFKDFLLFYKPDVIHFHTLMGLHKEFIEVAHDLKIKTVFTAHDFFPICPKVTMFYEDSVCLNSHNCELCCTCNYTALSLYKIILLQSPIYRALKNNIFIKKIRKKHRDQYLQNNSINVNKARSKPKTTNQDYIKLRHYYGDILSLIDTIHYNSNITKNIYETFFSLNDSHVIGISHNDIQDKRRKKEFSFPISITYLGPQGKGKGFYLLQEALDSLWETNKNFTLNIYFNPIKLSPYMKIHERYTYKELETIFNKTDVLIIPSLWYETFGYIVLEALSFGVPVILSDTVGAKDIIPEGCGIIIENINKEKLIKVVNQLSYKKLVDINQNIIDKAEIMTLEKMTNEIIIKCYL